MYRAKHVLAAFGAISTGKMARPGVGEVRCGAVVLQTVSRLMPNSRASVAFATPSAARRRGVLACSWFRADVRPR